MNSRKVEGGDTFKSKKLVMMTLTIRVLMLTLSIIGTVAAKVPPQNIHATVYGWGRVERKRGSASLSVGFGTEARVMKEKVMCL